MCSLSWIDAQPFSRVSLCVCMLSRSTWYRLLYFVVCTICTSIHGQCFSSALILISNCIMHWLNEMSICICMWAIVHRQLRSESGHEVCVFFSYFSQHGHSLSILFLPSISRQYEYMKKIVFFLFIIIRNIITFSWYLFNTFFSHICFSFFFFCCCCFFIITIYYLLPGCKVKIRLKRMDFSVSVPNKYSIRTIWEGKQKNGKKCV